MTPADALKVLGEKIQEAEKIGAEATPESLIAEMLETDTTQALTLTTRERYMVEAAQRLLESRLLPTLDKQHVVARLYGERVLKLALDVVKP